MRSVTLAALLAVFALPAVAQTAQTLPFTQDWSDINLIQNDDDWSGVVGIIGYRGDDLATGTGTDPQTVLADGSATPVDVLANRPDPSTLTSGGVAEFDQIANPVVALQGSGTADAPHLVIRVNTTGVALVRVRYVVRDVDGSMDDATQQVALQYRVGTTGDYVNVPAGYIADATTAGTATQETAIDVTLPADAGNQASVDIRVITTNAPGSDEWVGIDDIQITAAGVSTAGTPDASGLDLAIVNPLAGIASLRYTAPTAAPVALSLFDVTGRRVAAWTATGGQSTVDASALPAGVYVLRPSAGAETLTRSVTVVR